MKTKNFLFKFVIIGSAVVTIVTANAEDESPMKCGVQENNNIECTVVIDSAQINDVVLNRGRCKAPDAATPEDIAALEKHLEKYVNQAGSEKEGAAKGVDFSALEMQVQLGELFVLAMKNNKTPQEESVVRAMLDPRKEYNFGDKFEIFVPASCNLIEYTIDVNDDSWTWTVE